MQDGEDYRRTGICLEQMSQPNEELLNFFGWQQKRKNPDPHLIHNSRNLAGFAGTWAVF